MLLYVICVHYIKIIFYDTIDLINDICFGKSKFWSMITCVSHVGRGLRVPLTMNDSLEDKV